eukprot:TRINITY_DN197_c0_g1_i8.p2 TRINITY_DN197_c0_g1~~TRINITY_DN197_c0_g1_i8.p2  ORF type:complete len:118 (+),score=2.19 TRINITY_DN197_c0_g1_i8:825-1178(+)
MLNVSCPFHSRLMLGASRPLASYLRENVSVRRPTTRWFSNLSAKCLVEPVDIIEALVQSTFSTVQWSACVSAASSLQPELFVEVGPREVLAPLIRQCDPSVKAVFFETVLSPSLFPD